MTKTLKTLAIAGMTMGLALGAKADTVACTNCITFSADKAFGIRMVKGSALATPTVTLEYSTDQVNWNAFSHDTNYKAGADHKLYLRGKNNTRFAVADGEASSCNVFTNTSDSVATAIACSGNIETLLDYTKVAAGQHPSMDDYAFCWLFSGFAALTTPPALPATTLTESCYSCMFHGCTSLTAAPELSVTKLASGCYSWMFYGCTSLTAAPTLPATTLVEYCYYDMFSGCTSLTEIPALNVAVVTNICCHTMFQGCTNLVVNTEGPGVEWCIPGDVVVPPSADSTTENYWATDMFAGTAGTITNSSVVTPGKKYYVASAPVEFRVTQPEYATFQAYANGAPVSVPFAGNYQTDFKVVYTAAEGKMFPGGYRTLTTNVTASAATVTVTLPAEQQPREAEANPNCLTFSASEDFGIKMWKMGSPSVNPSLEYSTDQIYWEPFNKDDGAAAGADHKLYLRGTGNTAFASSTSKYYVFTNTSDSVATAIACSGNIETLLDHKQVAAGNHPEMGDCAFFYLFNGFAALTTAPKLPAMTMKEYCYFGMFNGCTLLTAAPELPATNLAEYCYYTMFSGCTSLTAAPELPATNLAASCYSSMFGSCTLLTAAPELPAKSLAASCYSSMFYGCTSLTAAPELPATNLAKKCYQIMFAGCTSLVVNTNAPGKAWSIPAEAATSAASADKWNSYMFAGTPGDITNEAVTCGTQYYIASVPVPIPFDVTAPAGTEAKVYTNAVNAANYVPAGGTVWSYRDAFVVYTVTESGKYFENGQAAVTNRLDTKAVTATDAAAPTKIGTPALMLGVVAQRYPWNGMLDIQYKTPFYCGVVTFKANGTVIGTAQGTGGQEATASFDLNSAEGGVFKDKALKNVKITAAIE